MALSAEDDELAGIDLLQAFAEQYEHQSLPLPPVPETMLDELRVLGEAAATTRGEATPGPFAIRWFVDEILADIAPDYCLFGEDGHGLNSYGFHWYLVAGHVAIFVQVAYGGVYQANSVAGAALSEAYDSARKLIDEVIAVADAGNFAKDQRVIVVDSFIMGSTWTMHSPGEEPTWREAPNPCLAAAEELVRRSQA